MSGDLTELRILEKTVQGELKNLRERIEQAEAKIKPLRTVLNEKKQELTRIQQEIITDLQERLSKERVA